MPTKEQSSKGRHERIVLMGDERQQRRGSLQHQHVQAPKEKVTAFRGSIDAKFEDRITPVKNGKLRRQPDHHPAERGAALKSSKPWPGRKATTVDELVKHMSNVPSYLQHSERADHLQDKALNVGVLEWDLLARWTHNQKHVTSRSNEASPSSANEFLSPARSSASPSSRAVQRKKSPIVNGRRHPSVESQQTYPVDKQLDKARYSSVSRSPVLRLLPGHAEYLYSEDGGDYGGARPSNVSLPSDATRAAPGIDDERFVTAAEQCRTKKEDRHNCAQSLFANGDKGKNNCLELSENNESMRNLLQQSIDPIGINFSSPVSGTGLETEGNGNCSPDGFLEDIGPSYKYPYVPYSCPLPYPNLPEEVDTSGPLPRKDYVGTIAAKRENMLRNRPIVGGLKKPAQIDAIFNKTVEKALPDHHPVSGLNRMSRSSSWKEASSARQPQLITSVDKMNGNKSTANNKGRRSPLRRMLDPFLNPRRTSSSSPIKPSFVPKSHRLSNMEESASHNVQHRSVGARIESTCQTKGSMTQPPRVLLSSAGYLQQERGSASTRQALLQLAWKNGLPLFMLSYGDSDVLAATVRRKDVSDKDDLESMYTIFTVQEPTRKGGAWFMAGHKNKKQQLVSNVVGKMGVSLRRSKCCSSKNSHSHREFVLVGSELLPSDGSADSHVNRELAAIISKVPHQGVGTSHRSCPQDSGHMSLAPITCSCPLFANLRPELSNVRSGVIAILPSGFHGSSSSGEPSPLIERWRSGGACDCGGWDEGCNLTVLSDDSQQCMMSNSSVQSGQTMDSSQRFDLLVEGRPREDGHAFSMVSLNEGLFTVEFSSSIALLQAFVMCIAMLHGRSHSKQQVGMQASQDQAFLANQELKVVTAAQGKSQASYVSYHPPWSPVGRA